MKKLVREDYRVIVRPESLWMQPADECVNIRDQIIRHVDVSKRSVDIECNSFYVCEFCKWRWEPDFDGPLGPGCCSKAQEEWEGEWKSSRRGPVEATI